MWKAGSATKEVRALSGQTGHKSPLATPSPGETNQVGGLYIFKILQ